MSEPLILKVDSEPTYFNKEAAIGLLMFNGIGAIVGGFIGKERMEKERIQGRVVEKPTDWNQDALLGGLIGSYIGAGLGMLASMVVGTVALMTMDPALLTSLGAEAALQTSGAALMATAAGVGTFLLSVGAGAWIGGDIGKQAMHRDVVKAEVQRAVEQDRQIARDRNHEHHIEHEMGHGKNHAQAITAERERAASQIPVIG